MQINKCRWQTFSDDYSQEFVICNETGIDISLIVAHHHKFRHQNKKQPYIICWYVCFRWHQSLTSCLFLECSKDFAARSEVSA